MTHDQSTYLCNDDDLNILTGYFTAALAGEESKSRLQRMWEQEIGIIKATRMAAKQYELPACEPDKPCGIPSHPAAKVCTECHARKCCVLWDCPLRNEIWKTAQEKLMDDLGILHGEDAKRFNEQLDHPEPLTPEARDLVMQAKEIAKKERTALDYSDHIKDLETIISLSKKLLHQFPNDVSLKMSMQQASQELKRLESLSSEITNQRSEK